MEQEIVGIVFGAFDLLHAGHILMLRGAREHCDYLIACLHIDPSIERPEKNKPVQTVLERMILLNACRYVDEILVYETERDVENILKIAKWDVRFMDEQYVDKPITAEWSRQRVRYIRRQHDYSSSELRKRMAGNDSK